MEKSKRLHGGKCHLSQLCQTQFYGWLAGKCAVTWEGRGVAVHVCTTVITDFMVPPIMQWVAFTFP